MGITKSELFTDQQNELAMLARVLGHPARIAILQRLAGSDTCINSHLVHELGLAQATISQHLRELKNAGLIQGTIEGASMNYCIDRDQWHSLRMQFNAFFDMPISGDNSACC